MQHFVGGGVSYNIVLVGGCVSYVHCVSGRVCVIPCVRQMDWSVFGEWRCAMHLVRWVGV